LALDASLWTEDAKGNLYGGDAAAYQAAVLEQYKIYVEMADRVSQRRGLTNTFFLTLNTAIFTAVGLFWEHKPQGAGMVAGLSTGDAAGGVLRLVLSPPFLSAA
jgi:hypothetical protein